MSQLYYHSLFLEWECLFCVIVSLKYLSFLYYRDKQLRNYPNFKKTFFCQPLDPSVTLNSLNTRTMRDGYFALWDENKTLEVRGGMFLSEIFVYQVDTGLTCGIFLPT